MSAPLKSEGRAPRHRKALPRIRVKKHYDFRPEIYGKLGDIRKVDPQLRKESETEAIERLILEASQGLRIAA